MQAAVNTYRNIDRLFPVRTVTSAITPIPLPLSASPLQTININVKGRSCDLDDFLALNRVTLRNILMMSSGVKWDETYTDKTSDRRRLLEAQISQKHGSMLKVMKSLKRIADPGTVYNYN